MNQYINRPYRFDFFTIWGNGLKYIEEILTILRNEKDIEIILIKSLNIKNMRNFVFNLYACDAVPIYHLKEKMRYLFDSPRSILIVFVKNYAPEETPAGLGEFRKVQCQYINRIKWNIRDNYNPRKNGVRTEEHVVHTSDYEEQVDFFLKMLGYKEGIKFIVDNSEILPFKIPYHIKKPNRYIFKKLPLSNLRASILSGDANNVKTVTLEQTPHYRGLCGKSDYEDYLNKYKYEYLTDNHYLNKLLNYRLLDKDEVSSFPPVLINAENNFYRIIDGVHRAVATLYHKLEEIKCVEFLINENIKPT